MAAAKRAIGIIRVSEVGDREGESFTSPVVQEQRIRDVCERDGLDLVRVHEELDVSGGKSLTKRPGLNAAVQAIEAGEADVIAAAYFDRLFRSLATQAEVIERVEKAGGQVLAVDVGTITGASAGQWLSSTMVGAVSEYLRRSIKERSAAGQERAVARGAIPWSRIPLGYKRREDKTLAIDAATAPLAKRAFEMRDEGLSIMKIRNYLSEHGVERSRGGVEKMFASRIYLGEIHYGDFHNPDSHDALIDRDLWDRVNGMKVPRGPQGASDRLLARLQILRCGSCGGPLGTMKVPKQDNLPIYRCPSHRVCPRHVTINADIAEEVVVKAVRGALADAKGRASAAKSAQNATRDLEAAQADLDAAIRSLAATGLENEPAALERLAELRELRDQAKARENQLGANAAKIITLAGDWDDLSLEAKRAIIKATVARAVVVPTGKRRRWDGGAQRVTVHLVGE